MQCPRCGFHNLPGEGACISCRVPFGGGPPVAVLAPPRAPAWRKRARRWFRSPRLRASAASSCSYGGRILLGLLPGLPQLALGPRLLGLAFAFAWLLSLFLAFQWLGTAYATPLAGIVLGAHVTSALLPFREELRALSAGRRAACSLLVWACMVVFLYAPLQAAMDRVVFPVRIAARADSAPIHGGDVVLVRRVRDSDWHPPVGILVAFQVQNREMDIDRVLGVAGDRLEMREGALYRNDVRVPPEGLPLRPDLLPPNLSTIVPDDSVFVWPSLGMILYNREYLDYARFGIVPRRSLLGVPWRIWQPFDRRRVLEP